MHIHNVYFWLNDCSDKDKSEFEQGLTELLKIPLIKEGHWGIPAGVQRDVVDGSFDYSLTVFFDSRENHDAYQSDDDHNVFIKNHSHLWKSVKVLDSTTK